MCIRDMTISDGPSKKRFAPLKSLKRFFAGTKKKKTKDDVTGVGMKSTPHDILDPKHDERDQLARSDSMSMSTDMVFLGDRPQEAGVELPPSMEVIPRSNFKDELAQKLQGRQSDDDEGLPSSPPGHASTVDVLIENSLKEKSVSTARDHSLMSMDSPEAELEENFFRSDWASSSVNLSQSPGALNLGSMDLDLDVVVSTTSLNTAAAKHKIAIKPKQKPRGVHVQRHKTTSPISPGGVTVLAKVHEEITQGDVNLDIEEDEGNSSQDQLDLTDDEIDTDVGRGHELRSDQSDDQLEDDDAETQEVSMDISEKTGISSDNETPDSSQISAPEEKPIEVVMRKKEPVEHHDRDASKRSTIIGDTVEVKEVTPFGERRVKRSSLVIERNWDEIGKSKEKEPEDEPPEEKSEFANVFAKFKKHANQKKTELDKKADSLENRKGTPVVYKSGKETVVKKESSNVTIGFTLQNKGADKSSRTTETITKSPAGGVTKAIILEKKNVVKPKPLVIQKSNGDESSGTRKEKVEIAKDSVAVRSSGEIKRSSGGEPSKRSSSELAKRLSGEKKTSESDSKILLDSSVRKEEAKKVSPVQSPTSTESKILVVPKTTTKFAVIHQKAALKPEPANKTMSQKSEDSDRDISGDKSAAAYKRDSPRVTNRFRSQTLPESAATSHPIQQASGDSSVSKRANLQEGGVNKENIPSTTVSSSPKASILRSAATPRSAPQRLGAGGQPSWLEAARKRTEGWNETDKDSKDKKAATEEELKDKRSSVLDLMKRFQ